MQIFRWVAFLFQKMPWKLDIRKIDISGKKKSGDNEGADEYSVFFKDFIKKKIDLLKII